MIHLRVFGHIAMERMLRISEFLQMETCSISRINMDD
jgi:hypothetical protein